MKSALIILFACILGIWLPGASSFASQPIDPVSTVTEPEALTIHLAGEQVTINDTQMSLAVVSQYIKRHQLHQQHPKATILVAGDTKVGIFMEAVETIKGAGFEDVKIMAEKKPTAE